MLPSSVEHNLQFYAPNLARRTGRCQHCCQNTYLNISKFFVLKVFFVFIIILGLVELRLFFVSRSSWMVKRRWKIFGMMT